MASCTRLKRLLVALERIQMIRQFPKIDPENPLTYNRKYRRALAAIRTRVPAAGKMRDVRPREMGSKRRFALLSNLIGAPKARAEKVEHHALVTSFMNA